jgi:hypothetical protein
MYQNHVILGILGILVHRRINNLHVFNADTWFNPHWLPPSAALTSENTQLLPKFSLKTRFLAGILLVGRHEVVLDRFRGCAGRPSGGAR